MTAREELAAVLAEHQRRADRSGACHCGEWPPPNFGVPWMDHLADALLASPALTAVVQERIDERDAAEAAESEPCDDEIHSWDYFQHGQVDSYWIRCTRLGPHDEHEDPNTGAHWGTKPVDQTKPEETP